MAANVCEIEREMRGARSSFTCINFLSGIRYSFGIFGITVSHYLSTSAFAPAAAAAAGCIVYQYHIVKCYGFRFGVRDGTHFAKLSVIPKHLRLGTTFCQQNFRNGDQVIGITWNLVKKNFGKIDSVRVDSWVGVSVCVGANYFTLKHSSASSQLNYFGNILIHENSWPNLLLPSIVDFAFEFNSISVPFRRTTRGACSVRVWNWVLNLYLRSLEIISKSKDVVVECTECHTRRRWRRRNENVLFRWPSPANVSSAQFSCIFSFIEAKCEQMKLVERFRMCLVSPDFRKQVAGAIDWMSWRL